jgi:RNA polymerase sigma-70 factor (ECF subfamily)
MPESGTIPAESLTQDDLYQQTAAEYGPALDRLARAHEADADKRRDLLQEIHIALWRSFSAFEGRCSLRTWVYRVAHNAAASHVLQSRRMKSRNLVSLDVLDGTPDESVGQQAVDRQHDLDRLMEMIQRLKPVDRQIMLLYLEGEDAASIGEITGVSPGNVATKVHRIKRILAQRFSQGGTP